MERKKNGFTTIELITTFALTLVIVVLLLQVVVVLKDVYINKVIVNSLRVKQAVMTEKIMDDFDNKNLAGTAGCVGVSNCISFIWEDGSVTELKVDKTNNTFSYNDYITELTGGSSFGNFSVTDSAISIDGQRRYITFSFPVYSKFVSGDYGVHVIYQFNPKNNGIKANSFGNTTDGPSLFILNGDNPVKIESIDKWSEPGYKAFYNGNWNTTPNVTKQYYGIAGTSGTEYTSFPDKSVTPLVIIKYTYTAPDGKVYTQTRNVIYTDYAYDYKGVVQTFVAPADGYYRFQAWGAQGGSGYFSTQPTPGLGAYTSGVIYLNAKQTIYVYVGGKGGSAASASSTASAGYNGGGIGSVSSDGDDASGAGGGATDFRLTNGNWSDTTSLASRIMIAGGGGGSHSTSTTSYVEGMNAGTLSVSGMLSTWTGTWTPIVNQTTGNAFGIGAAGLKILHAGAGGGGGYYGGVNNNISDYSGRASGGSSYVSGHIGCVAITSASSITPKSGCNNGTTDISCSIHYSGKSFTNTTMISGTQSMPNHDNTSIMVGNTGNGYAKINYLGTSNTMSINESINYAYQGMQQLFIAPTNGYYKLEAWGAQGGTANSAVGGKGAYTVGKVYLSANESIYIYVGGKGSVTASGQAQYIDGGYNGGGSTGGQACCNRLFGSGGGASDFRLKSGTWNDSNSLASRIMVAAGGGGAFDGDNCVHLTLNGGSGGTLIGISGAEGSADCDNWCYGLGGSQTSGGSITTSCAHSSDVSGGTLTGAFGIGGSSTGASTGGGGGYYGGSRSGHIASAGGGSSYVSGYSGCVATSKVFTNANMIDGNSSVPTYSGSSTMAGNTGDGYAKITYVGTTN